MATGLETQLSACASDSTSTMSHASDCAQADNSRRIRMMTWNIDGRHPRYIDDKTTAVCEEITAANPHFVFLQEVVMRSESILSENFPAYQLISGYVNKYFYNAIMVRTDVVEVEETDIIPFKTSQTGRNMLAVKCKIKGEKFYLMTTHLEATKKNSLERGNQFLKALVHMLGADADRTVLFGGDVSLREHELSAVGLSGGIQDVWEILGKRMETKYTWDLTTNDNYLSWGEAFTLNKFRFDRVYIKHPVKQKVLKPIGFELTGTEKLESCGLFPSDHWAILCQFDILPRSRND